MTTCFTRSLMEYLFVYYPLSLSAVSHTPFKGFRLLL